jgi:hypothetical protein
VSTSICENFQDTIWRRLCKWSQPHEVENLMRLPTPHQGNDQWLYWQAHQWGPSRQGTATILP